MFFKKIFDSIIKYLKEPINSINGNSNQLTGLAN